MTAPDPLLVLLDRACRAVTPDEAAALRAGITQLRQQLAAFHEGEEPYEDDAVVPTPAQWIWRWNRATPVQRLAKAAQVLDLHGLAKAAQVLDLHEQLDGVQQALVRHGDRPILASAVHAALHGNDSNAAGALQ